MRGINISTIKKAYCPTCLRREILAAFGHVDGYVLDIGCGTRCPTKFLEKRCKYIGGVDLT